jgi:hypothetical protein
MYNMTRGLTPAKFDCNNCHSAGSPFADGTDQACLWNIQQMWAYATKFEFEDVWVLYPDQCPEGYILRDLTVVVANYRAFTDAGTKNCFPILSA